MDKDKDKIGIVNHINHSERVTTIFHYISIFNNLDCRCVDNIVVDNISNFEKDDFEKLYMLFIGNVELSEYTEFYSELILDDCMNNILEKLREYRIIEFAFEFKLMKLFIIFYLFFYVKTKLDFHNLLMLYTSIFKCLYIDYSEYLISNISQDKFEEINIEYNLNDNLSMMKGGSNNISDEIITTFLISSISVSIAVFLKDWKVLAAYGSALVAIKMFNMIISENNIDMVKLLSDLEQGADINLQNKDGNTALIYAIRENNIEMVKLLLLEKGADTNLQNKDGNTALIYAIRENNIEMVKLLLEQGANTNLQNKDGNKGLMYAIRENNIEIVKLLLDYGALYSKIVGPISMYYYRIPYSEYGTTFKKILLFGDIHTPITEKCSTDCCIYYDQYINLIIDECKNSSKCIDLYLENGFTQHQMASDEVKSYRGGSSINQEDTLEYMRRIFDDCSKKDYRESLYNDSLDNDYCLVNSKQVNNLRFHNIDMRLLSHTTDTGSILDQLGKSLRLSPTDYNSIIIYILGYDDILEEEIQHIFTALDKPLSPENLTQLRWIRNKTNKEYDKYKKTNNTDLRQIYYENLMEQSNQGIISQIHIIDFYTMLRMFMDFDRTEKKSIRGPRSCRNIESQNRIISYTGHAHTANYVEILQKQYDDKYLVFSINHNEYKKILEFKDADINTEHFNNFDDIIDDFCHL